MAKKLTWSQFYKTLRKRGMSEAKITGLWPDYATSGKLPGIPNWKDPGDLETANKQPVRLDERMPTLNLEQANAGNGRVDRNIPDYNLEDMNSVFGGYPSTRIPWQAPETNIPMPLNMGISGTAYKAPGQQGPMQSNPSGGGWEPSGPGFAGYQAPRLAEAASSGFIKKRQATPMLQEKQSDFGLGSLFDQIDMGPTPNFQYQDFTNQANDIAAKNFAPQYQALDQAQQNTQGQYNNADAITKGMYEKLVADTQAAAQQTGQQTAQNVDARGQAGNDLAATIANTYASTQGNQADLLAKLGLASAAPTTLQTGTDNSAWQQGQANINTGLQKDYIASTGQNQQNYLGSTANAESTQGVVAREGLISQLAQALSQIDAQRSGVASEQSQSATDLGLQLSDRNYNTQRDNYSAGTDLKKMALDNMLQRYQLSQQNRDTQYNRKMDSKNLVRQDDQTQWDRQIDLTKLEIAQAEADAKAGQGLDIGDQGAIQQAYARMADMGYDNEIGASALNIAQQVAAGAGDPNNARRPKSQAEFINQVVQAGQAQGITDQAVLLAAAEQIGQILGFGKTPVAGQVG